MILSHHGQLDFGSPVVPMTPEAIFLATLDNLDAKVNTFTRDIREDRNAASAWTQYSQALGRRLYKGAVGEQPEAVD
jgi:3'-5' exoribonuclease